MQHPPPKTANPATAVSRRHVLQGSLTLAVGYLAGCAKPGGAEGVPDSKTGAGLMRFQPVLREQGFGPLPTISPDYEFQVLIPWGEPINPDGPAFSYPPSAADQARQVGIGHDGMTFFPLQDNGLRGVLAINHEYGRNSHVLGHSVPQSLEDVRTSQHAHGMSLLEIAKLDGRWQRLGGRYNRRIHVNTDMAMSGPVAGSPWIRNTAGNPLQGTLGNCANGWTPWGTYLTCEENFNLYFGANGEFENTPLRARYGLTENGAGYGWHRFDPRFDHADSRYANEANRFGWIVEVDPHAPQARPVKRSALGRVKHEGAAMAEGRDGQAVVYMGDDQRFEFIYRFVSARPWREMRAAGESPLDDGILYVARFDSDNRGEWLPLTLDNPRLKGQFADQAELLVKTRLAATLAGATPMDRPEWTTVAPNGDVYCTLTNNSRRTEATPANPVAPNLNGHIMRWHDDDDHVGTGFSWDIFLLADDHYETENSFGSPDGLLADADGRLFICTDGEQFEGMNNQLLVADTESGEIRRLLTGVAGCEITGLTMTPDRTTLFVNVQHPGNGDPARTNFPAATDGITVPRDCTLAIRRKDGGIVGS